MCFSYLIMNFVLLLQLWGENRNWDMGRENNMEEKLQKKIRMRYFALVLEKWKWRLKMKEKQHETHEDRRGKR